MTVIIQKVYACVGPNSTLCLSLVDIAPGVLDLIALSVYLL